MVASPTGPLAIPPHRRDGGAWDCVEVEEQIESNGGLHKTDGLRESNGHTNGGLHQADGGLKRREWSSNTGDVAANVEEPPAKAPRLNLMAPARDGDVGDVSMVADAKAAPWLAAEWKGDASDVAMVTAADVPAKAPPLVVAECNRDAGNVAMTTVTDFPAKTPPLMEPACKGDDGDVTMVSDVPVTEVMEEPLQEQPLLQ